MRKHAILSPSSAERWLNCTPSARMEEKFPDKTSVYTSEGTLAHSLGELILRRYTRQITEAQFEKEISEIEQNDQYSESMYDYAEQYASFVLEQFYEAQGHTPDTKLLLEYRLDMTEWVPEGFGTGDAVILADNVMHLIDLKYGKGVTVSVEHNRQMMLYALGALHSFGFLYDVDTVRLTIFQPRIDNISTWEISVEELYEWAEKELKPLAQQAYNGEGEFVPGPHCGFCKAKPICKALYNENMKIAKHDFADPATLTDEELVAVLSKTKQITDWLKAVEEYALAEALKGKKWPGYKVVEGRSNRKYADEDKVKSVLTNAGYSEDDILTIKLQGITAITKLLGKSKFTELVEPLLVKPPGAPTLVPESDKRPAYDSSLAAAADFA
jgi:hypothetical protein